MLIFCVFFWGGGFRVYTYALKSIRLVIGTMSDFWGALAHLLEGSTCGLVRNVQFGARKRATGLAFASSTYKY